MILRKANVGLLNLGKADVAMSNETLICNVTIF